MAERIQKAESLTLLREQRLHCLLNESLCIVARHNYRDFHCAVRSAAARIALLARIGYKNNFYSSFIIYFVFGLQSQVMELPKNTRVQFYTSFFDVAANLFLLA